MYIYIYIYIYIHIMATPGPDETSDREPTSGVRLWEGVPGESYGTIMTII